MGQKIVGGVDLGVQIDDDPECQEPATEALVMLLNCINGGFKVPLGYFFITSLTGDQRASLVRLCLQKLDDIGAKTISLVCDGPPANLSMAKKLGVNLNVDNFSTRLKDRTDSTFFLLDPPHMLKVRFT